MKTKKSDTPKVPKTPKYKSFVVMFSRDTSESTVDEFLERYTLRGNRVSSLSMRYVIDIPYERRDEAESLFAVPRVVSAYDSEGKKVK